MRACASSVSSKGARVWGRSGAGATGVFGAVGLAHQSHPGCAFSATGPTGARAAGATSVVCAASSACGGRLPAPPGWPGHPPAGLGRVKRCLVACGSAGRCRRARPCLPGRTGACSTSLTAWRTPLVLPRPRRGGRGRHVHLGRAAATVQQWRARRQWAEVRCSGRWWCPPPGSRPRARGAGEDRRGPTRWAWALPTSALAAATSRSALYIRAAATATCGQCGDGEAGFVQTRHGGGGDLVAGRTRARRSKRRECEVPSHCMRCWAAQAVASAALALARCRSGGRR